jgi:hypothetical protein
MQQAIDQIVTPVLTGLDAVLPRGYAAVLYGSGARGEFVPGVSDVNLLIVCEALDVATLNRLAGPMQGLRKVGQPPPLMIQRDEWERAADVFPIEITDMQVAHILLRGADPVTGLHVEAADLRRALEAELRGKLVRLRQAYAAGSADPELLSAAATGTVSSVATLFRVSLVLAGKPAPADTTACIAAAGQALGVATAPVAELWTRRRAGDRACSPALFEGYLTAVADAVRVTDQFTRGGS